MDAQDEQDGELRLLSCVSCLSIVSIFQQSLEILHISIVFFQVGVKVENRRTRENMKPG